MAISPTAILYLFDRPDADLASRRVKIEDSLKCWVVDPESAYEKEGIRWTTTEFRRGYPVVEYWLFATTDSGDDLRSFSQKDIDYLDVLLTEHECDVIEFSHGLNDNKKSWFQRFGRSGFLRGEEALVLLVVILHTHNTQLGEVAESAALFLSEYSRNSSGERDVLDLPFAEMKSFVSKWLDKGIHGDLSAWLDDVRNRL